MAKGKRDRRASIRSIPVESEPLDPLIWERPLPDEDDQAAPVEEAEQPAEPSDAD
jgi:hypothetical protein